MHWVSFSPKRTNDELAVLLNTQSPWRSEVRPLAIQTLSNLTAWHDPINQASVRFSGTSGVNSAVYWQLDGPPSVTPRIRWPLCFCIQPRSSVYRIKVHRVKWSGLCMLRYNILLQNWVWTKWRQLFNVCIRFLRDKKTNGILI